VWSETPTAGFPACVALHSIDYAQWRARLDFICGCSETLSICL